MHHTNEGENTRSLSITTIVIQVSKFLLEMAEDGLKGEVYCDGSSS
ncbi:hypothetical protein [Alkalinema sp. FACHB-956]|nr:hypothetical protein [Alkalinema sp. FACHB-956]MBD2328233.1 hypothetical protein [Alkalinema sp. FACHB-956]